MSPTNEEGGGNIPPHRSFFFNPPRLFFLMTEIELLEELTEDNLFLRRYPTLRSYVKALAEALGSTEANCFDAYELYAAHIEPEELVTIWETYSENN